MTVTVLGEMPIGSAIPGVTAALATALADIQAKVTALAQFSVSITPPSLNADLEIAANIVANIEASLTLGITPPSIDLQAQIMLDALIAFKLQLQIILDLHALLLASVHLYQYDGQVQNIGTELQAQLSGGLPGGAGTDLAFALLFAATAGPSITALQAIFKNL